ncbi:hypothetical protein [Limnoglobus roseus]|uniref:hypothetical protein n=1 Tax=Limnoglobus roseus TaxID=2598579 RepID=UPI0011EACCE4|nr:hypothetical protein [Limnoglobus roseus]
MMSANGTMAGEVFRQRCEDDPALRAALDKVSEGLRRVGDRFTAAWGAAMVGTDTKFKSASAAAFASIVESDEFRILKLRLVAHQDQQAARLEAAAEAARQTMRRFEGF